MNLLHDLLVVDLGRVIAGPYAAMLLGDLGARVIKVEQPGGDDTRSWGPPFVDHNGERVSSYFLSVNRNKESIALDLKNADDRQILRQLIERADVLIENFRPGVMDRLGLGDGALKRLNPRLILLSISAYGHDGPDAIRAGYDQLVQGETGLMSLTGHSPDAPTKVGVPVADVAAAAFGAAGVLAALHARRETGVGRVVRTSLLSAALGLHAFQGTRWLVGGELPLANGNHHPTVAPYGAFAAADGPLQICVGNDATWVRFAPLVGLDADAPEYRTNADRIRNRDALHAALTATFQTRGRDDWIRSLDEHDIPCGRIRTIAEVYDSEQVSAQGGILEILGSPYGDLRLTGPVLRFDDSNHFEHRPPPTLDADGDAVRAWLAAGPDVRQAGPTWGSVRTSSG